MLMGVNDVNVVNVKVKSEKGKVKSMVRFAQF